jgi:hypothetical protein
MASVRAVGGVVLCDEHRSKRRSLQRRQPTAEADCSREHAGDDEIPGAIGSDIHHPIEAYVAVLPRPDMSAIGSAESRDEHCPPGRRIENAATDIRRP